MSAWSPPYSACFLVWVFNRKYHFRALQKLHITNKFGEQDVWGYYFNAPEMDWVTVVDMANKLMYEGRVKAFSDNSVDAEVLLEQVSVYDEQTGEYLYGTEVQYLSLNRGSILIQENRLKANPDNPEETQP